MFFCNDSSKKFKTNNIINRHKPTERALVTAPCGARTTIDEIILNLNMRGEEERKGTVLARSTKRADILYHLNLKSVVLILKYFSCFI